MRPDSKLALVLLASLALAACGSTQARQSSERSASHKTNAAEVNVSLGQSYLSQGKYEIALDKLQKALKIDPKLTSAHTVLAVLYERIGNDDLADRYYQRAVELSPDAGATNNNYGAYLCHKQQYENADRHFQRALKDPFYATPALALANRGTCALSWGKAELAEESFRKAVQIQPDQPEALYRLAEILNGKGDYFRARAFVQRFESASKATPDSLILAMRIEEGIGDRKAARDYKSRLLGEFPESEQAQDLKEAEATR